MLEQAMVTLVYSGVPEEAQTVPGVRVCGPHHTRYDSAHWLTALYVLMVAEELEEHPSGLDEETARKHVFQVIRAINFCHQNQVSYRQHCIKHLHSKLRSKWPLQPRIISSYQQWVQGGCLVEAGTWYTPICSGLVVGWGNILGSIQESRCHARCN